MKPDVLEMILENGPRKSVSGGLARVISPGKLSSDDWVAHESVRNR